MKCELCPEESQYEYNGKLLCSTCVSAQAALIELPQNEINAKPPRNRGKNIDEIETSQSYSGERSPYWDFLQNQSRQNAKGGLLEDREGNLDVLPESASPWNFEMTDEAELRLSVIRDVETGLTSVQRRVLDLSIQENMTTEKVAAQLNMTRLAVRTIIGRINKEVVRKLEARRQSERFKK